MSKYASLNLTAQKRSVLQVGEGRGFAIKAKSSPLVITSAHCLPFLPPADPSTYEYERTFSNLLALLGEAPQVDAVCIYVDPISDVAVLHGPDGQERYDAAEAYDELLDKIPALTIADAPEKGRGWLLSLDAKWNSCNLQRDPDDHPFSLRPGLWLTDADSGIYGGMSGSPILNDQGEAIGLISTRREDNEGGVSTEGGPNPRLLDCLPGWLTRTIQQRRGATADVVEVTE